MKKILFILTLLIMAASVNNKASASTTFDGAHLNVSIIPEPVKAIPGEKSYVIDKNTVILAPGEEEIRSANFLKDYISKYYGLNLEIIAKKEKAKTSNKKGLKYIKLGIGSIAYDVAGFSPTDLKSEGAYILTVSDGIASLTGANPQGLFYAVQTLIQLLPTKMPVYEILQKDPELSVQQIEVIDFPRFVYRGMHLDVVRHIFSLDYIKKYIDYLALHKMNYFHWHLTDDQGWRMESKSYPRLNEIGSWRAGTIIGLFPGTGVDSTRYGGYYTTEELKEIVRYAADRYVTIVPEIDVPGHSMAIIAAYPQFSTTPEIPKQPAITWGIFNRENNVLAPSEEVFKFLSDVFNELMDVFPGEYIHIGADECSKRWWKESARTQLFMKKYGISDEDKLQAYFVRRISEIVTARGRKIVGWDEIMDGGLVEGAVVMSWRNAEHGWEAAEMGHKAILTPMFYSYLNFAQKPDEDTLCHNDCLVTVDSVYHFEPAPDRLSFDAVANILGGQGCMWTEYFPTVQRLEYALFPRFSALSEVYWSQRKVKNWPKFQLKLPDQFNRYDLWKTNYSTAVFEMGGFSR
jgi:hexosaminidase